MLLLCPLLHLLQLLPVSLLLCSITWLLGCIVIDSVSGAVSYLHHFGEHFRDESHTCISDSLPTNEASAQNSAVLS